MSAKAPLTLLDYPKICMKSFEEEPFNEIDSAIFSWLSYLLIHEEYSNQCSDEGMPLPDLLRGEYFEEMLKGVYWPAESFDLMVHVIASPRYRGAVIRYYRNENALTVPLQFSAMVIGFREGFHYVVYRGTDKTVNGWKEDMMLIMSRAAPGQTMAVNYLNGVGGKIEGDIIVGGHSKGGNLAVYAAANCRREIQDRILRVYSHDGPGFLSEELNTEGMRAIRDRIVKNIPTGSVVGLILKNEAEPEFIKSNRIGPFQHFPGSWEISGNAFVRKKNSRLASAKIVSNVNRWAESVSDEEIAVFMNTLFEIIESAGVSDLNEILENHRKYVFYFARTFVRTEPGKRKILLTNFMNALGGKIESAGETKDEYDLDWKRVEHLLKDSRAGQFGDDFDLFL